MHSEAYCQIYNTQPLTFQRLLLCRQNRFEFDIFSINSQQKLQFPITLLSKFSSEIVSDNYC